MSASPGIAYPTNTHDPLTYLGANRNTMGPCDLTPGAGVMKEEGDARTRQTQEVLAQTTMELLSA
jgi:hypothetical protein